MLTFVSLMCMVVVTTTSMLEDDVNVLHRSKRQAGGIAENGINCTDGTVVRTPYMYTNSKTRDTLLGEFPDPKDSVFLDTCKRWLGSDHKATAVYDAYVTEAIKYENNETVRFRATVCCKDKPTKTRCFSCVNESSSYACDYHNDLVDCAQGEQCLTSYSCEAHRSSYALISKGCSPANSFCNYTNGFGRCNLNSPGDQCSQCCDNPFCNENGTRSYCYKPGPVRKYIYPCSPSPCKNGGMCKTLALVSKANYSCCCLPGYKGKNCTEVYSTSCAVNDCLNGGTCVLLENKRTVCNCTKGYVGDKCEKKVEPKCYDPRLLYKLNYHMSSSNCSNLRKWWLPSTFVSSCRYQTRYKYSMTSTFVTGVDGQVSQTDYTEMSHCYGGESCAKYTIEVCCPSCHTKPCENGGYCVQTEDGTGDYVCKCRFGYNGKNCQHKVQSCMVFGDPHYFTFDSKYINFQGIHKYLMVKSLTSGITGIHHFNVSLQNEERNGLTSVTFPKYFEIGLGVYVIKLDRNKKAFVKEASGNYQQVYPHAIYPGFTITMNGHLMRFETSFGLVVEYDGDIVGLIQVPSLYAGHLSGLCNDMDGVGGDDDLLDCNGVQQQDTPQGHAHYGDSCLVNDPENPIQDGGTVPVSACSDEDKKQYSDSSWCGPMKDANGPFAACIRSGKIKVDNFFTACVFDVCRAENLKCASLTALATRCAKLGAAAASDWRATVKCPMTCPTNAHYEFSGAACQPTCENLDAVRTCGLPNTEVCVCNDGLILKDGSCMQPSACGCKDDNTRYNIGDTWGYVRHPDDTCTEKSCVTCTTCAFKVGKVEDNFVTCRDDPDMNGNGITNCTADFNPDEMCNSCDGVLNQCNIFGDPCDKTKFYTCSPNAFGGLQAHHMPCPPCQVWAQDILTCVRDDSLSPTCVSEGVIDSGTDTDDNWCTRGDDILKAVPGEPTKFTQAGKTMSCSAGTIFDLALCVCNHGNNPATGSSIGCIDFNDGLDPLKSSLYVSSNHTVTIAFGQGIVQHALQFDSTTLEVPYFKTWQSSQLSVTLWFKRTDASKSGRMTLLSNALGEVGPTIDLESETQGTIGGGLLTAGPVIGQTNGATGIAASFDTWHHVALVYNSAAVNLYLDGKLKNSSPAQGQVVMREWPLFIGSQVGKNYFNGLMDEICFYGVALSPSTVETLYKETLSK